MVATETRPPCTPAGHSDAVTFHGHIDDVTKHQLLQSRGCTCCLRAKKDGVWRSWRPHSTRAHLGYRSSGGLSDSIVDGVTGILVDSHAELLDRLGQLLCDPVLRDQLGAKAQARSVEFSWTQSADAMRTVLEAVQAGSLVTGLV